MRKLQNHHFKSGSHQITRHISLDALPNLAAYITGFFFSNTAGGSGTLEGRRFKSGLKKLMDFLFTDLFKFVGVLILTGPVGISLY